MYCHVQFYITSLEYCALGLIYAEFKCTFQWNLVPLWLCYVLSLLL